MGIVVAVGIGVLVGVAVAVAVTVGVVVTVGVNVAGGGRGEGNPGQSATVWQGAVAVGGAGGAWVGCGDSPQAESKTTTNPRKNNLRTIFYLPEIRKFSVSW